MPTARRHALLILGLLAVGGWCAAATLYRWVDAQGVVHYSDTPHPGAEVIQLSGAQTYHSTPGAATPTAPPPQSAAAGYQSCVITQPVADAALYAPEAVAVSVQLSPGLREGDQLSVQVDGQQLPSVGGSSFQLQQPARGDHTVTAQVLGPDGAVLCSAPQVNFSVQRPSVNTPQSPVKPH